MTSLRHQVDDKTRTIAALTQDVEDQRDESRTLKRKHAANIKVGCLITTPKLTLFVLIA